MKKTLIIYILFLYYLVGNAQVNLNFETGDFTGWTGRVGNTSTPGIITAVGSPTIWTMGVNSSIWNQSYHTITTGAGTDPFGGASFPVVAPGGTFSARLGGGGPNVNNGGGCGGSPGNYVCPNSTGWTTATPPPFSGAESLEQSFVVTSSNCIIELQYATVFNNGSHSGAGATVNPWFRAEVLNSTGASISNCLTYTFVLNKSSLLPGSYQSASSPCYYMPPATGSVVVCMPWQRKIFDLSSQIGQTVTVKFSSGGCQEGGHFGYAYIDAAAGPKALIQTGGSGCSGPKILTGPTQYAGGYTWSGPPGGITASSANTATVNTTGIYSLTVGSGSCAITFTTAVNLSSPTITALSSNQSVCSGGNITGINFTPSPAGTTIDWTNTNTNVGLSALGSGSISAYTSPTVTSQQIAIITATPTFSGCAGPAKTFTITINPYPNLVVSGSPTITCSSTTAVLSGTSTTSGVTYAWLPGGSAPTSSATTVSSGGTYTLTTSFGSCSTVSVVTVIINTTLPNASANVTSTITCLTNTTSLNGFSSTSGVTYSWNPGGSSPTNSVTTVSAAGNYTLSVTNPSNGCKTSTVVSVVSNSTPPNVTSTASNSLTCTNNTITVSATTTTTPISYNWSGVGITSPTNTNSITVNQPGTFNYTVTNTINGCSTTGTQSISQNTIVPTTTLTPSSLTTTCASPTATLLVTSSSDPNSTFTWTVPASGSLSNTSINNPVASGSGVFTVAVTNTLNGCVSAIQTVTITADANTPTLTATANNSVICSGLSSTLSVSGADSYTWSASAGSVITNTVIVSPTTTTTYSVIGTNTLTGCSNVINITVIANTTPTVGISSNVNSICIGENATISLTGASSYTITNPLIVTTSSIIVTPTTPTTYTIIGETAGCISTTGTISVGVNPLPTLNATVSSTAICSGSKATLNITGADTYTWSTLETATTITVSPTTTTTYSVTGTTTTTGCSNITNVTVNVTPTPTIGVAATATTICEGNTTTLTLTGATNYTVTNPSQTTTNTIVLTPSVQTTYTITGEQQGCASTTETITIDVNALPIIAVSNATTCAGTAVTLSANGADTYNWQPTGSTTNTTTVTPTNNTTYTVTGTNTVTGCTSTLTTVDVTVNALPTVTATANPNTTCTTGTVNLTANTTATSYTWTTGNGVDNTNQNQGTISFPASTLTTGTYTYTVTVTDVNGCVSPQASTTINIIDVPNANFDLSDLVICQNENGTISINSPQTGVTYDWNINGQTIPNTNPLTVPSSITNASGTYTVNVIAGIGTCTNTAANTLTVNALPTVSLINAQVSACENTTAQLDVAGPNSTYTYNWTNGTNTSTGTNLTVNPLTQATQGTYTVTATDANGCTNRTIGKVDIKLCETFIPEIFTPNGDGKNDGFVIKNIENYPNNKLKIFNRWGNLIYEKDKYQNEFEGYANTGDAAGESKLPSGTYYVILDYGDGETETYNGYLLLQY